MHSPPGVGVDIVRISTVATMLSTGGSSFQRLCWTPSELAHCGGSASRLAARWAAKEAAMKALGRGLGDIDPTDIEVTSVEGQRPALRLRGAARAFARAQHVELALSMSHEDDMAIAFVVAAPRSGHHTHDYQEGDDDGRQ